MASFSYLLNYFILIHQQSRIVSKKDKNKNSLFPPSLRVSLQDLELSLALSSYRQWPLLEQGFLKMPVVLELHKDVALFSKSTKKTKKKGKKFNVACFYMLYGAQLCWVFQVVSELCLCPGTWNYNLWAMSRYAELCPRIWSDIRPFLTLSCMYALVVELRHLTFRELSLLFRSNFKFQSRLSFFGQAMHYPMSMQIFSYEAKWFWF